jgi:hypothetical protein
LIQFASAQRVQKIALQDDALALPPRQTFLDQMLGPSFHGIAGLTPKSTRGKRHGVTFDQPVVEPGRSLGGDLLTKIEIGTSREHQGGTRITGLTEAADFDDPADRRSMFEGLDSAEADVVRASVSSVDHGIGLAGQLVVQSPIDQPSGDLRTRPSPRNDVVGHAACFPALGEGAVHGLDDVAAHAEVAKITLCLEPHHPFPLCG